MFRRFVLLALLLIAMPVLAVPPINQSNADAPAVKGYDVVAYFEEGAPKQGSAEFTHQWRGAEWRFASAAHRDLFAADPERYAPQYGGYCAYAMAWGGTADIDPRVWKIVDGKLYLNMSRHVQRLWEKDVPGNVEKADINWPKLTGK